MRNVVIALLIFVVMIVTMVSSIKYLNKVSQDLGKFNDQIEQNITDDDWDRAYKTSIEFTHKWEEHSKKIKLFVNHQEIDKIEIELWKLPQYVKERTKDESLACVHILKFLLNHIAELEKVKIRNIF